MLSTVNRGGSRRWAGVVLSVLAFTLAGGCVSTERVRLGSVVEAEELVACLSGPPEGRPLLLDVREAQAYDAGHLRGAVRVDPAGWKDASLADETGLDHETLWRGRIGALGISGRRPVVIYDDGRLTEAARVWFILQHFGVPEAGVLNGGFPALQPWIEKGQVVLSREPTLPASTTFEPAGTTGTRVAVAERQRVRAAVERGNAQVFDARTRAEYTGQDLRKNTRGGHIPGAINIPHKELLDEHGRLRSPGALAALFEQAGFKRGQPVITHCDGGGRASLAALAAERAGYGPVLNYYLSFGDWAADATCPVVQAKE